MRIPAFLLSILILRGFILAETPSPRPNGDADSHTTYIAKNFKVAGLNVSASALPQQQDPVASGAFIRGLGTAGDDYASSIQRTSDQGFIISGYTTGAGAGREDLLLMKLDVSGTIQWAKTAGTA